jgi:hypothetical protein
MAAPNPAGRSILSASAGEGSLVGARSGTGSTRVRALLLAGLIGWLSACGGGPVDEVGVAQVAGEDGHALRPAGSAEPCAAVGPEVEKADRAWRGTPEAQAGTEQVDAVLAREFGADTKVGPTQLLSGGVLGVAGDAARRQLVVVVDPAQVDVEDLAAKPAAGRDERGTPTPAAAYVRAGCHPAADLLAANDVLSGRQWHPEAVDVTYGFSLNQYDSTWHVGIPEGAAAVALKARLGDLVHITYDEPEQRSIQK